jgi:hypothetical protein
MRGLRVPGIDRKVIVWWTSAVMISVRAIRRRGRDPGRSGAEKIDLSG